MRVISGLYKSRRIRMPKGAVVRPTKDRIREALFNIVAENVNGARVLDLFAGSGAFGIEALSRGAENSVFVDSDARCVRAIKENLEDLGIEGSRFKFIRADAMQAIKTLQKEAQVFDLIFIDPPYYRGIVKKCLIKLDSHDILSRNCIVCAEHFKKDVAPEGLVNILLHRTACYGDIRLSFYKSKYCG